MFDRYRPLIALGLLLPAQAAVAHDPVFGLGPHVLYKGGVEIAPQADRRRAGSGGQDELALELTYGLTGDWAIGIDSGYADPRADGRGADDPALFSKYRFWRNDMPGAQESAAVLLKVKPDSGAAAGTGSNDAILGLTYGYESRRWYRWASLRYRYNGEDDDGLQRGGRWLVDFVGGIRPTPSGYLEPDTVWLLELNGEITRQAQLKGDRLPGTGGTEWFLSPGLFWTYRNFAVKAGVQIPVLGDLNGAQDDSDYRARLVLEWHL